MLDQLTNLLTSRNSRRKATLAMARIISQYDIVVMPYETGVSVERRSHDERHAAFGVWLIACDPGMNHSDIDFSSAVPAVTHDLRSEGFGVLTPLNLDDTCFVVAVPDGKDAWRFFQTKVCHKTLKDGGWYHVGLHLKGIVETEPDQSAAFREHIRDVQAAAAK
ncbi:MAG: hypothetical protein R3C19_03615 [Planctomycetaceae bacterium]